MGRAPYAMWGEAMMRHHSPLKVVLSEGLSDSDAEDTLCGGRTARLFRGHAVADSDWPRRQCTLGRHTNHL